MGRTWSVLIISPVVVSAGVTGCASLPSCRLTSEQFQEIYAAPRLLVRYGEYEGVHGGSHRMRVYALWYKSWAEPVGIYFTPASELPHDFPTRGQSPIIHTASSPEQLSEWRRAWEGLSEVDSME